MGLLVDALIRGFVLSSSALTDALVFARVLGHCLGIFIASTRLPCPSDTCSELRFVM